MTLKQARRADEASIVDRRPGGLTWIAHSEEEMRRASHALVAGDEVWLVDPLDAAGIDREIDPLGTVAGVAVLTNSHTRDAETFAERYDVGIDVPACFDDWGTELEVDIERFGEELGDTGFRLVWETAGRGWSEGILYNPDRETLVVADALMTSLFAGRDGQLELFPLFKFSPPAAALADLAVERILVGHGDPVVEGAEAALENALSVSRGRAAASLARSIPTFARVAYTNLRE